MTGFRHNGGPPLETPKGPKCPGCNSSRLIVGGYTSFHWRRGRWVEERGAAEMSDGGIFNCQDCGEAWCGDYNPPFNLRRENNP